MRIRGIELHVREVGEGSPVVFSHGLLLSGEMFAPQVDALSGRFRCIAYDHRGQGRSDVPSDEVIEIETVYEDAVALIEALDAAPCHFVGLSMGGFVGLRIAARRPEFLRSLALMATAADAEPEANLPRYRTLNRIARFAGLGLLVGRVMPILCGASTLEDPSLRTARERIRAIVESNRRSIYRAVNGVLNRESVEDELPKIRG